MYPTLAICILVMINIFLKKQLSVYKADLQREKEDRKNLSVKRLPHLGQAEARNFIYVFHTDGRCPSPWAGFCYSPRCFSRELEEQAFGQAGFDTPTFFFNELSAVCPAHHLLEYLDYNNVPSHGFLFTFSRPGLGRGLSLESGPHSFLKLICRFCPLTTPWEWPGPLDYARMLLPLSPQPRHCPSRLCTQTSPTSTQATPPAGPQRER